MANVNKRSRAELGLADPASDNGRPADRYPQLGRDVPSTIGPDGYPVVKYETRIQSYGEHGLRRETRCLSGCGKWLTFDMCPGCQSLFRLLGRNDMECRCFKETLFIYGHCEDHRRFEGVL